AAAMNQPNYQLRHAEGYGLIVLGEADNFRVRIIRDDDLRNVRRYIQRRIAKHVAISGAEAKLAAMRDRRAVRCRNKYAYSAKIRAGLFPARRKLNDFESPR